MELMEFVRFCAMAILFGALWTFIKGHLSDGPLRRAMAAIYN